MSTPEPTKSELHVKIVQVVADFNYQRNRLITVRNNPFSTGQSLQRERRSMLVKKKHAKLLCERHCKQIYCRDIKIGHCVKIGMQEPRLYHVQHIEEQKHGSILFRMQECPEQNFYGDSGETVNIVPFDL